MKKGYVDINVVLDRSGSMASTKKATIEGYNEFINSQKGQEGEARFTLAQFDDVYEVVYGGVLVDDVPPLTNLTFVPRGMTALYDAIGKSINDTGSRLAKLPQSERPEKVIFVIITDGGENQSKEFTNPSVISNMITHQQDKYNWEFIFIGANQDAIATARTFGIAPTNAMTYTANAVGSAGLYESVGANISMARSVGLSSTLVKSAIAFKDEDKKKQEDAKKVDTSS